MPWAYPTRYASNPVLTAGGGGWTNNQFQDPVPLIDPLDSSQIILFFSGMAGTGGTGNQAIGRATAPTSNPFNLTLYGSNPIISDTNRRMDSLILLGGTMYLFSTNCSSTGPGNFIDLFTSTDNGFTWSGPTAVLTPTGQGRNDGTDVSQAAVILVGGVYYMYYSYRTGSAGGILPGIRFATSTDLVTWTKGVDAVTGLADLLVMGPHSANSYDRGYCEFHQVIALGSTLILTYEGYSGLNGTFTPGTWTENIAFTSLATPASGWMKSAFNPLFIPSGVGGTFDFFQVATPAFLEVAGTWYLYYQGEEQTGSYLLGPWSMGMATLTGSPLDFIQQIAGPSGGTPS